MPGKIKERYMFYMFMFVKIPGCDNFKGEWGTSSDTS